MSIAAYLVCHRDRTLLGLGQPLRPQAGGISAFSYHSGEFSDATFARGLWKYLADHPGDDLALHFDSDPEFDGIAAYREIGGDVEDGDVPLADYLAGEPEMPTVYYATLRPGRPRSDTGGIVRRRGGSPPVDEAFTRTLRWAPTEFLRRAALGLDDTDHVEIPETEAVGVVLRLLAAHLRPGWPQDDRRTGTPRRTSDVDAARLLEVDFDGVAGDPDSVIVAGLADPRHLDRVLPLSALLDDRQADPLERLYAAVALTTWGEAAGYRAVVAAARDPRRAPWYGRSIDRKFSVDNTFSWFATAIRSSRRTARVKGTVEDRIAALRALVGIADGEYFDEQLEWAVGSGPADRVAADVEKVVRRGVRCLDEGGRPPFDLATQLVDLATALTPHDEGLAVHLATSVIAASSSPRTLRHAAGIVTCGEGADSLRFAEHLTSIGDDDVRRRVARALELRRSTGEGSAS